MSTASSAPVIPSQVPVPDELLTLAPLRLLNHRHDRYAGDELCVSLGDFAQEDRGPLQFFYEALSALLFRLANKETDAAQKWREVENWTRSYDLDRLIDQVRAFGVASHRQDRSELVAKTVHDLRGGALSALLGRLQMLTALPRDEAQLNRIFVLTRDHLKIMRNGVTDLDSARREADRKPKAHAMRLMLDKWQNAVVGPKQQEQPVEMRVDCRYEGALTECCLESAAIDRIFYNLTNNAARHAAGGKLDLVVFPVPDASGECLRFVLSNAVSEKDAEFLRGLMKPVESAEAPGLPTLFKAEVSSTGSGFGLTVVADFVAKAFGLPSREEALRGRYVGAVLEGQTFRAWFHWLAAHDDLPPKLDDFRQPEQSLSEP